MRKRRLNRHRDKPRDLVYYTTDMRECVCPALQDEIKINPRACSFTLLFSSSLYHSLNVRRNWTRHHVRTIACTAVDRGRFYRTHENIYVQFATADAARIITGAHAHARAVYTHHAHAIAVRVYLLPDGAPPFDINSILAFKRPDFHEAFTLSPLSLSLFLPLKLCYLACVLIFFISRHCLPIYYNC